MAEYGIFLHVAGRQRALAGLFEEVCAEAQLAEAVGFSSCFIAEHHQSLEGHFGGPLVWCAAIAARTTRLKIGPSVLLLPLYHPVHVAEDAAMVDVISGGRLILGVGLGYQEVDYALFESPIRQRVSRMEEGIEIIRCAWTEERFSFHGKRFDLADVSMTPKPLQKPHPPIWVGAMSDEGIKRAARQGDGWIADPLKNIAGLQHLASIYRDLARRRGQPARVAVRRDTWVAPTRRQAVEEYSPAVLSAYRYFWEHGGFRDILDGVVGDEPAPEFSMDTVAREWLIIGSPAECREQLARYEEELGVEHFILRFRHPSGPPHEQVMRAIRRFGEDVIQRRGG